GKSQAAAKPAWYLPAAMGKKFEATDEELIQGLSHPAQSVRFVAMRRIADRVAQSRSPLDSKLALALDRLVRDANAPPHARWSAIWALERFDLPSTETLRAALKA